METCVCHLRLILLMLYFVASTASRNDVSSPNNVTFGLKGIFNLFWEWKPFSSDCSIRYDKDMSTSRNGYVTGEKSPLSSWEYEILSAGQFDLNDNLSLSVEAKCNNTTIDSLNRTVQLAPGDERTAVKDFHCVWHYTEHVKCTWQPGPKTPPNVNYRIFYWTNDWHSTSEDKRLYTPAEFWDLLETGRTCERYSSNDLEPIGCQFLLNKSFSDFSQLAMVVTDASKSIKPYIYYENSVQIAKLKPPKIIEAYRTANNTIYVSCNISQDIEKIEYEFLLTSSSSKRNESYNKPDRSISLNVQPDDTYKVKVRVKISKLVLSDQTRFIWSDWSNEKIFEGKDDVGLLSIIIPLIVSAVFIVAAIFLLVHMEKLKVLMCPQIPDPARIFPKDLQHWLKNDVHIAYNKPEKEEICPVYLMESSPATKFV